MKKFFLALVLCHPIANNAMDSAQEALKIYTAVDNQTLTPLYVQIKTDQAEFEGTAIANQFEKALVLKHTLLPYGPKKQGSIEIILSPYYPIVSRLLIQRKPDSKKNDSQFKIEWAIGGVKQPYRATIKHSFSKKSSNILYGWRITQKLTASQTRLLQLHLVSTLKNELVHEIEL